MDNIYHQDNVRTESPELDELTQFIRNNYIFGLSFMCLTLVMWLIFTLSKWHPHKELPFPIYLLVITVFLVMMTLNCIPKIASCSPCKWIMAVIVVLCTTIAGCVLIDQVGTLNAVLTIVGVAIAILVLNFSGSKCPQDFLPGGVCSTILMMILLLVLICVGIAQLFSESRELLHVFVCILFIMVVIAILIQAQFNHGRLTVVEVSPPEHQMICALTLYLHTMIFLFCVFYFIQMEKLRQREVTRTTKDDSGYYTQ
ncbi:uncharacterized protein [Drosophila kikkawai]|uniref:Uncharacterized protein n=1 Tax=Drosophila kikkawai TaxID=30033 RepID=A0A6P4INF2_DROKI|nr:uncharacterized protein LOC108075904 [Drosophila kikkawai]